MCFTVATPFSAIDLLDLSFLVALAYHSALVSVPLFSLVLVSLALVSGSGEGWTVMPVFSAVLLSLSDAFSSCLCALIFSLSATRWSFIFWRSAVRLAIRAAGPVAPPGRPARNLANEAESWSEGASSFFSSFAAASLSFFHSSSLGWYFPLFIAASGTHLPSSSFSCAFLFFS